MKRYLLIIFFALLFSVPKTFGIETSDMTKLWCTVYFKHWAVGYANSIGYMEKSFYLYLDEQNNELYNEQRKKIHNANIQDGIIKYIKDYREEKKRYTVNYTIDRYTGRVDSKGIIRHDYGAWASLTYENRDFEGFGQCAKYSEVKKF